MSSDTVELTVVIPTLGRLEKCVNLHQRLHALKPQPSRILFVFQDASEWKGFLRTNRCAVLCSTLISRKSAASARNWGIQKSSSLFTAFLDDDCEPMAENWAARIIEPLQDARIGLVTGPVHGWKGASGRNFFIRRPFQLMWPILQPVGDSEYGRSVVADTVAGGNFAGRTRELRCIGGFSEEFSSPSLFEETELSLRFRKTLKKSVFFYQPAAVIHRQMLTGGMRHGMDGAQTDCFGSKWRIEQRRLLLVSVYGDGFNAWWRLQVYRLLKWLGIVLERLGLR